MVFDSTTCFDVISGFGAIAELKHLCLGRRTQVRVALQTAMDIHHCFHSGRHKPVEDLLVVPLLPEAGRPLLARPERLARIHCLSLR